VQLSPRPKILASEGRGGAGSMMRQHLVRMALPTTANPRRMKTKEGNDDFHNDYGPDKTQASPLLSASFPMRGRWPGSSILGPSKDGESANHPTGGVLGAGDLFFDIRPRALSTRAYPQSSSARAPWDGNA